MALLTEHEVSQRVKMSVHWLRRKRWSGGGIPYVKMSDGRGGAVRYREEDVEVYMRSRGRRSTSEEG
ncbi:helix-turn-helix transcriptional regulator [Geomonas sp. RF6]|uniref:helix-turn-helix transcriptional regulator n=1 Tax=Geomonas sp. RF6 TaxID=2897342 RepID=UPI003FA5B756